MSRLMVRGSGRLDVGVGGDWGAAADGGDEEFNVVLDGVDQGVVAEDGGRVQGGEDVDGSSEDRTGSAVRGDGVLVRDASRKMGSVKVRGRV